MFDGFDWQERREYTYTIRAICEIRPPSSIEMINDLYQDTRPYEKKATLKDARVVEVLIFPFATAHIYSQPYPKENLDKKLKEYIQPTVSMNYSPEMKEQIDNIVAGAATDIEAIKKMLQWMNRETELVRELPHWEYFNIIDGKIVWHKSVGDSQRDQQFLETNFFGDSMFKKKVHGTCSSTAILRGTTFRAAGLPTRLIQTLPLITRYSEDSEPLADRLRMREMVKGYTWGPGNGGANHTYNEVFLNNRWVRVDNSIGTGPFVGDKLFVKAWSSADWNNLKEEWNNKRCFRALDVSDAYPKYKTESTKLDIAIEDKNLVVTKQPDGLFEATIRIYNKGSQPIPQFGVYFYAGDPDKGGRLLARHAAGPIMPGGNWGEYNPRLKLRPGENTISVVVDPENRVEDSDETNNKASRIISSTVDIGNSQTSDRPSTLASKPPQLQTRTSEFVAILSNGVTLELLGVCEHPSEGKQWWRPDGSLIDKAPYKTTGSRLKRDKGYNYYEFVLRLKGPSDTSYKWQIPGGRHSTSTGTPIDEHGDRVSDLRVYTANQPENKTTALVRIGLSADKWKTLASHPVNIPEETYTLEDGENAVAFGRAYEKESQTIVPLAHTLNRRLEIKALRLIAVTKNGEEIRGSLWGRGGNILSSNTYGFHLSLRNIKEFRFQTRSYHWVEFKNVSLRPGYKTNVQF